MGMAAILFNGSIPFKQIVNILPTEAQMWNLVKNVQTVSEKKTFNDFSILYTYIAQGQRLVAPKNFIVAETFYYINHTLLVSAVSLIHFEGVGRKFDVKRSKVNLRSSFEQPWVPETIYQNSALKLSWFWRRRFFKYFLLYMLEFLLWEWRS